MEQNIQGVSTCGTLPLWVPESTKIYLDHIEGGVPLRAIARSAGCHASTILRVVQKTESRRDDPLVDSVLSDLGRIRRGQGAQNDTKEWKPDNTSAAASDEQTLQRETKRVLSALIQPGTLLAVTPDAQTAVVLKDGQDGIPRRVATVDRSVAEVMALQDWIICKPRGRVSCYFVTAAGRSALNRFLARSESARAGFSEAPAKFFGLDADHEPTGKRRRKRSNRSVGAESPLQVLGRRKDKSNKPYLTPEQISAGERLRMDFELSRFEPGSTMNWERLVSCARPTNSAPKGVPCRQLDARRRLEQAIRFLGPELGEVSLITCCHQQGMEAAENLMNMPARSGKIVLRIALNMLLRHYQEQGAQSHDFIY